MKKTYLAPAMVVTEIGTEELICQSGPRMGLGRAGDNSYGLANDRYDYDDDEDEEDLW